MITKRNAWHPEALALLDKGLDRGFDPQKLSLLLAAYGYRKKPRGIYSYICRHGLHRGRWETVRPYRVPSAREWEDYIEQLLPFLP